MKSSSDGLIYDVGLYDGSDTAYYLFKGYRVVAIDANPAMIESARQRFRAEIEQGRLVLLNAGIAATAGELHFWVSELPEWSSFDRKIASRDGKRITAVKIATVPLAEVLRHHGTPEYLKIDIEGNDRVCVEALRGNILPKYISVESECVGDSDRLSDEQALEMLGLLHDIGYRRFKLITQCGWTAIRHSRIRAFAMRVLTSISRGTLRIPGIARFTDRYTDLGRVSAAGFPFASGATGPWGEEAAGGWMSYTHARRAYLRERHSFFDANRGPLYAFWHDWHATI